MTTGGSESGIEIARKEAEPRLLALPNVVGVGIGKSGDEEVIKVFVERKVARAELQDHELVPPFVDGFPVEVEEIGHVSAFEERR